LYLHPVSPRVSLHLHPVSPRVSLHLCPVSPRVSLHLHPVSPCVSLHFFPSSPKSDLPQKNCGAEAMPSNFPAVADERSHQADRYDAGAELALCGFNIAQAAEVVDVDDDGFKVNVRKDSVGLCLTTSSSRFARPMFARVVHVSCWS
jgi:hypothetical protein